MSLVFRRRAASLRREAATFTANVITESSVGQDGSIAWQTAFLLNDGRIATFGIGNHSFDYSNAMRIIDVTTSPITTYDEKAWDYDPPPYVFGSNRTLDTYDNHPSCYLPPENKIVWFGHGVFDFALGSWTYGNRAPSTQAWDVYVDKTASSSFDLIYNPAVAWCGELNFVAFYGVDGGGNASPVSLCLTTVEKVSGQWKLLITSITGAVNVCNARNSAVCIGHTMYVGGDTDTVGGGDPTGGTSFFKIDLSTKTFGGYLTPWDGTAMGLFPQMCYDSTRNKILLIGERVLQYDPTNDSAGWLDITPANYLVKTIDGHSNASGQSRLEYCRGVYSPTLRAFFFTLAGGGSDAPCNFQWHKLAIS